MKNSEKMMSSNTDNIQHGSTKPMLPAVFYRSVRQKLNYKQIKNKNYGF